MLTENEVGQLIQIPEIRSIVQPIYQGFVEEEQQFQHLSLHDFLSGMLMIPSIALARVDGATSLFEELALNKKARRFSKGGFFLKQDPVIKLVGLLQERLDCWESRFLDGLNGIMKTITPEITSAGNSGVEQNNYPENMFLSVMKSSYILIRFLETFFLPEGEELTGHRTVSRDEYEKILNIGERLQLSGLYSFQNFTRTFEVK